MENKKVMTPSKFNRGIYLTPQVQYELKKIACTYHITLKSLIPAMLWHIANNNKKYQNSSAQPGPHKLKHVLIDDETYQSLKIQACEHHMLFTHYLNVAIMETLKEPYSDDTCEEEVMYFFTSIIQKYQTEIGEESIGLGKAE